jgi:hypothetical protein
MGWVPIKNTQDDLELSLISNVSHSESDQIHDHASLSSSFEYQTDQTQTIVRPYIKLKQIMVCTKDLNLAQIATFVLLHGILILYSLSISAHSKYSVFYSKSLRSLRQAEVDSLTSSLAYINTQISNNNTMWKSQESLQNKIISTIVLSKSRPNQVDYISRTTSYYISRNSHTTSSFTIFNTERPPENHNNAQLLAKVVHSIDVVDISNYSSSTSWYRNEITDYAAALFYAHQNMKSDYIVILQDDAIVRKEFTSHIIDAVKTLDNSVGDNPPWYALKLFYSDRFHGWAQETLLLYIITSSIYGILFNSLYTLLSPLPPSWPTRLYVTTMAFLWVLSIGHQTLYPAWPVDGLYPLTNNQAVLVGQVYPRRVLYPLAEAMIEFVDSFKESDTFAFSMKPVDLLIDSIAEAKEWKSFLMIPNAVQHIGTRSSNTGKYNDVISVSTSPTFPTEDEIF